MLCALSVTIGSVDPARADDASCPKSPTAYICLTFANDPSPDVTITSKTLYPDNNNCPQCDVEERRFETRSKDGPGDPVVVGQGLSISKLISTFGPPGILARTTFTQAGYAGGGGNTHQALLDGDRDELGDAPYQDGLQPTIFFRDPGPQAVASYIRPLRRGDGDSNNDDYLATPANSIHIIVHTDGQVLYPTLTRTSQVDNPDGTTDVSFQTALEETPDTELNYDYDFRDTVSPPVKAAIVTHTYSRGTKAQQYYPFVTVTGGDTSYGQSAAVLLQLGKFEPPPPGKPKPSGGGTNTSGQSEGQVGGGGNQPGGAQTPGNGAGGGTGNATGSPQPTPGAGNGTASGTRGAGSANGSASTSARASAGSGRGDLVQGLALYAPEQAAGAARSQAGQAEAAALRAGARDDRTDLRWLLWLIPIGLIGLGVFTERRRPRRQGSRT